MPDTARTFDDLAALFGDAAGEVTPQDMRDLLKSTSWDRVQIAAQAAVVYEYQAGNLLEVAMGTNITSFTVINGVVGLRLRIIFTQDATGGRTLSGMSGFVHENASAPVLTVTPLRADLFDYWYDGTSWVQV